MVTRPAAKKRMIRSGVAMSDRKVMVSEGKKRFVDGRYVRDPMRAAAITATVTAEQKR
jgi:hypothetical protein